MNQGRTVIHRIELSLSTKLLLAGIVTGLLLNALVPILKGGPAHAQGGSDNVKLSCVGQATGAIGVLAMNMDCTGRVR